jgi:hypothetical protein
MGIMSHLATSSRYSKIGYQNLRNNEEDERRISTSSSSPILPKPDIKEFEEESPSDSTVGGITFDTSGLETYYRPVEGYEGAHRYDPEYQWHPADERNVVRKVR